MTATVQAPPVFAPELVWSEARWDQLETDVRRRALAATGDEPAWRRIARAARRVMAAYTTSFFIVSRFLPAAKRRRVEVIYAAVRYPDEVVDSFPLTARERGLRLDRWAADYEAALTLSTLRDALSSGLSPFLAAFARVVREADIPPEHYRAFLAAMRRDISPEPYATLERLIDDYVYGSASVVGYFLAHVYGTKPGGSLERTLARSRELGIALQLTNFLRDVPEDLRRGRLYLPLDMLRQAGIDPHQAGDPALRPSLYGVIRRLAAIADDYYARARAGLDEFAPDCRVAISACIDVYGLLNRRILQGSPCLERRESVPLREKWRVLPPAKYWRIPLEMLRR